MNIFKVRKSPELLEDVTEYYKQRYKSALNRSLNWNVYCIFSPSTCQRYVGITSNLDNRILTHRSGRVLSTKFASDWVFEEVRGGLTYERAIDIERFCHIYGLYTLTGHESDSKFKLLRPTKSQKIIACIESGGTIWADRTKTDLRFELPLLLCTNS